MKCPCLKCFQNLEFEEEATGVIIDCPHCEKQTMLFVRPLSESGPKPWGKIILTCVAAAFMLITAFVAGVISKTNMPLGPNMTPAVSSENLAVKTKTADSGFGEGYATMINAFAEKNDMTPDEVIRWDYVLKKNNLTLSDFDQALTKLSQRRDEAAGYHIELQKHNAGFRPLKPNDVLPPQNPTLSEKEEGIVSLLKTAGYGSINR